MPDNSWIDELFLECSPGKEIDTNLYEGELTLFAIANPVCLAQWNEDYWTAFLDQRHPDLGVDACREIVHEWMEQQSKQGWAS